MELATVLDNIFKTLCCLEVGVEAKHTEGITSDEEDKLWETNVLNVDTSLGLLQCVFFSIMENVFACMVGGIIESSNCLSFVTFFC